MGGPGRQQRHLQNGCKWSEARQAGSAVAMSRVARCVAGKGPMSDVHVHPHHVHVTQPSGMHAAKEPEWRSHYLLPCNRRVQRPQTFSPFLCPPIGDSSSSTSFHAPLFFFLLFFFIDTLILTTDRPDDDDVVVLPSSLKIPVVCLSFCLSCRRIIRQARVPPASRCPCPSPMTQPPARRKVLLPFSSPRKGKPYAVSSCWRRVDDATEQEEGNFGLRINVLRRRWDLAGTHLHDYHHRHSAPPFRSQQVFLPTSSR